jgi:hypothetical protein
VHYHEAFWLIVGGAAPVVVLAVIVAATNEMQMAITLNVKLLFSYRGYSYAGGSSGHPKPAATVTVKVPEPRSTVTMTAPTPGPTVTVLATAPDSSSGVLPALG